MKEGRNGGRGEKREGGREKKRKRKIEERGS